MLVILGTACQWLAIATGLIAAWLWLRSAKPPTSTTFNITVVKPHIGGPLGSPLGATHVGQGYSAELDRLGSDLVRQSRLSAWAAGITAATSLLQAVGMVLHPN